jgi:alpha/beta superfamily hydrolase
MQRPCPTARPPVAWPSWPIPIHCLAAPWTTRWCRPWRAPSPNAAVTTVRFNFRGVGASAGVHDEGRGELQDLLAVVQQVAPQGPIALAGFSFGAFVTSHALAALWGEREVAQAVLVGTAASRFTVAPVPPEAHLRTLVLHGELDDTVPLSAVLDWARPQILPVTVVPGGGHFFHGQLTLLKNLVVRHLQSGR